MEVTGVVSSIPWSVIVWVAGTLATIAAAWGSMRKSAALMAEDIKDHRVRITTVEKQAEEDRSKLVKQVEQNRMDLAMYKLTVAETYVREADLGKMEERLGKRLDVVEHTIRSALTKFISLANGNREPAP